MFDLRQRVNGRPLLVGHRGAMAVAPENTMPSFEAGVESGADILELDVQLTADAQAVVFHDLDLLTKTGVSGRVRDFAADDVCSLDAGRYFSEAYAGTPIPRLHEVLEWASGRIPLMIEIKPDPVPDRRLEEAVVELVEDFGMVDQVVCISSDQYSLKRIKELNRHICTSFIFGERLLDPLALVSGLEVDGLSPPTHYLSPELVQLIQEAGYACSPGGWWWDYPLLLEWNVDSVSSNDPATVNLEQYL